MTTIENEIEPSADYLKGFNEGYLLSKERPELAETIIKNVPGDTERLSGFADGHRQYEIEKDKTLSLDWIKDEAPGYDEKELNKDLDIDKDDLEPEH